MRRKRASFRKKRLSDELESYIFEKIRLYWSPEQTAGRLAVDFPDRPDMRVSFKTIYRRIAKGIKRRTRWAELSHFLRLKRMGRSMRGHMKVNPGPAGALPSIETRPSIVAAKTRFGDWESDLVSGPKGKGYIATFVERKTNFLVAVECATRQPADYTAAALCAFGTLPRGSLHTVTVDRGSEFFGYKEIEQKLNTHYYFCHPRCPNERGLNEQVNGLLRQFFPKGLAWY
jgi:IS30 family transposase